MTPADTLRVAGLSNRGGGPATTNGSQMPMLEVNGTSLCYDVRGQGPPVLFLHGLGSSLHDWQFQVAEFGEDYQTITFDLRGHGGSARPRGPYSMDTFAADAAGLLRCLGIESAHVVGISLGGGIAFQMAVSFPGVVKSLVIVNSAPDATVRTFKARLMVAARIGMVRVLGLRRVGIALSNRLFPGPDPAGVRAAFLERFVHNDRDSYLAAIRAFIGWSVASQIEKIACPALVIAADNDYTPLAVKEAYVAKMPNAKLVVIPDSRHAVPVERPAGFNAVLRTFLEAQSGRDREGSEDD
jgi:pimeloyl-ACP methyl ester carboxylesterase